ncbi:MAG: TetR/AcrR family transcriptional regulator [Bacteroidota bacterium]|jgi:AcrR family transcriptional regulator
MDTQHKILQNAKEFFMRMGIRAVSMDDIANQTGISKKTIYQYYADKDELVDAVMKEEEESVHRDSQECFALSKNAVEEILLTLSRVYTRFSQMNPLVISDMERFHTKAHQRFQQMKYDHLYNVIQKNIKRGIKEGLYRKELNLEVITKYRLESIMIPFNLKVYPPSKFSLAEVTKELMEHFLIGLSTLKGHELILKYKEQKIKIA